MHPSQLEPEERASFDRAMATVDEMDENQKRALIEHAVASSIRYATERKELILEDWARGLLGTLRAHRSAAFRNAMAGLRP